MKVLLLGVIVLIAVEFFVMGQCAKSYIYKKKGNGFKVHSTKRIVVKEVWIRSYVKENNIKELVKKIGAYDREKSVEMIKQVLSYLSSIGESESDINRTFYYELINQYGTRYFNELYKDSRISKTISVNLDRILLEKVLDDKTSESIKNNLRLWALKIPDPSKALGVLLKYHPQAFEYLCNNVFDESNLEFNRDLALFYLTQLEAFSTQELQQLEKKCNRLSDSWLSKRIKKGLRHFIEKRKVDTGK